MSRDPMHYLDAIDKIRLLLDRNPFDVPLTQTLFRLFRERSELDKAYCVSMVLEFLNAATPESKELFRQFRERAHRRYPRGAARRCAPCPFAAPGRAGASCTSSFPIWPRP